MKKLHYQKY